MGRREREEERGGGGMRREEDGRRRGGGNAYKFNQLHSTRFILGYLSRLKKISIDVPHFSMRNGTKRSAKVPFRSSYK